MVAQTLEEMAVQGVRPDVGVLNIVINMLVSSGVVAAHAKAAQLFHAATRQGQLRCAQLLPSCTSHDLQLSASVTYVACVARPRRRRAAMAGLVRS